MPIFIANNLNALNIQHALNVDESRMSRSLERLSTGYKINSGSDDPAGLVISEQLRAQDAGLERALQNTQEANNVLGIAEGALSEMSDILKGMRQLAVHAANNGVTSREQVRADQAEIDSAVQTLDRIARTTRFSDQTLLNGNKTLGYDSTVMVSDANDMKLVNEDLSDIRQIFKRDDFKLNISFSGMKENAQGEIIENGNEAQKGYFEVSRVQSAATQVGSSGELTAEQAFTLSGEKGSRYLSFAKGVHLGEMVETINSVSSSTGVEATLVFDSDTVVSGVSSSDTSRNGVVNAGATASSGTVAHATGLADVFNRTELGNITTVGVSQISVTSSNTIKLGQNVDGDGRAYLKLLDTQSYAIYKDAALTMKVAEGDVDNTGGTTVMAVNNSEFNGVELTFSDPTGLRAGATSVLQLGIQIEDTGITNKAMQVLPHDPPTTVNMANDSTNNPGTIDSVVVSSGRLPHSMADNQYYVYMNTSSGVMQLREQVAAGTLLATGTNGRFDQAAGTISAEFSYLGDNFTLAISSDAGIASGATWAMGLCSFVVDDVSENDGVDMSALENDTEVSTNGSFFVSSGSYLSGVALGENTSATGRVYVKGDLNATGDSEIFIYKDARMRDEDLVAESGKVDLATNSTGSAVRLYATAAGNNAATTGLYGTFNFNQILQDVDLDGTQIEFTNLGMRLTAEDYGAASFVKVDQQEGAIFSRYREVDGVELLAAGVTGKSWTEYGRDATVAVNGQKLRLDGISGTLSTTDINAAVVFNEGGLGTTTLAAVGYNQGAWAARASMIASEEGNYLTHALHNTTESLGDWQGGMQFQLGGGAGDQARTVLSLKDVTATELGRVEFKDNFGGGADTGQVLAVNDLLSGGLTSLAEDPVKALEIIDQAIEDVSALRANIGAFQANMLQTNAENLSVAIENITKTESYIRDADMAEESTEFSKNQIMVQAATSMLAQANQLGSTALQLLG